MTYQHSRLSQTFSVDDDAELDEIIGSRAVSSEEDILHKPSPSEEMVSPQRNNDYTTTYIPHRFPQEPIPANRIALVRRIEEENAVLRRRQRWREMAYNTMIVVGITVCIAIFAIFFWLLYLALVANPRVKRMNRRGLLEEVYLRNADWVHSATDANSKTKSQSLRHKVVVVPRKMHLKKSSLHLYNSSKQQSKKKETISANRLGKKKPGLPFYKIRSN